MVKRWHVGLLVLFLVMAGCAPGKRSTIHGKVTYRDRPVVVGQVIVQDREGNVRVGAIGEDGSYRVVDVLAGPVKLAVESPDPNDPENAPPVDAEGKPRPIKGWRKLPARYADLNQSELGTEVGITATEYNLDLK